MKCDYCGVDYPECDISWVQTFRGKGKWICYKCREQGDKELHTRKLREMYRKKMIGDKLR